MIISFNFYYAREGLADAVLEQRLLACDVRERLGLLRGRVLQRRDGSTDLPDVIWELPFENVAAHFSDMDVRAASAEFEAVRHGMRKLYRRFERPLFQVCSSANETSVAAASQCDTVVLDWFYCAPDAATGLAERLQQSAIGKGAGPALSVQVLRLITPDPDLPQLLCKLEFSHTATPDEALREHVGIARELSHHYAGRLEQSRWSTL